MKHFIIAILLIFPLNAIAESPYDRFSTEKNFTSNSNIHWEQVDNVQEACNKQRVSAGFKPYSYPVEACSSWKRDIFFINQCYIITSKKVSYWTIGHEIRHCFQGDFHK
jgi:hypothetical protein